MPPIPLSLLPFAAQGVAGLLQTGAGLIGMNAKRPKYEMPDEIKQSTGLAALMAGGDMAGYGAGRDMAETASANAYKNAQESGKGMEAISMIQGNQNAQMRNLTMDNANYKAQQMGNYQNALNRQGEYADREWQINKFAPYSDKVQQGRQMFGAGLSNMFSGLQNGMAFDAYKGMLGNVNSNSSINQAVDALSLPSGGVKWNSTLPKLINLPN